MSQYSSKCLDIQTDVDYFTLLFSLLMFVAGDREPVDLSPSFAMHIKTVASKISHKWKCEIYYDRLCSDCRSLGILEDTAERDLL